MAPAHDAFGTTRRGFLAAVGATGLAVGLGSAQDGGDGNGRAARQSFTVTVENVSTTETLTPSEGDPQPVPVSPGAYAVHTTLAPLFTPGVADRMDGLEAIAEDGDPSQLASSLDGAEGIVDSGAFTTPVDASEPGPIGPGGAYEFGVTAAPGQRLSFASMFIPSNDLFFAPGEAGVPLFDATGQPVEAAVTALVGLWDAGTEANEEPGIGPNQAQRQSGPDTGPAEDAPVLPIEAVDDGYDYPAVDEVVQVSVAPEGDSAGETPTPTGTPGGNETSG